MKLKSPKLPAKGKVRVKAFPLFMLMDRKIEGERFFTSKDQIYTDQIPVAVASLSPEAQEARVEAGAKAIAAADGWLDNWGRFETLTAEALTHSKAVLASAGLLAGGKK